MNQIHLPEDTIDGLRARAPYSHRIVAKTIDFGLAVLLAELGFQASLILAILYLLFADAFGLGQSLGKRLLRLRTIHPESGHPCGLRGALFRNVLLVIPFVLIQLGLFFQILGVLGGLFIAGYEIMLLIKDPYGVRIGDILAGTEVIKLDAHIREPIRPLESTQVNQQPLFGAGRVGDTELE